MDVLGVHHETKTKKHSTKRCKKGIKVVYISSPMKVKACVSNFKALVQELTGKDSDADASATRFIDEVKDAGNASRKLVEYQDHVVVNDQFTISTESDHLMSPLSESPTASGSEMELFDDMFMPYSEGSFLGMFTSNLFTESFPFNHALRSLDSV